MRTKTCIDGVETIAAERKSSAYGEGPSAVVIIIIIIIEECLYSPLEEQS